MDIRALIDRGAAMTGGRRLPRPRQAVRRGRPAALGVLLAGAIAAFALALAAPVADAASAQGFFAWGNTGTAEPPVTDYATPEGINGVAEATAAAIGGRDAFLLTPSGVLGIGNASDGLLGLGAGSVTAKTSFTAIPGTEGATQVSAGAESRLVLVDGAVLAFGENKDGEAGATPGTIVGTPTAVPDLTGTFKQVASGYSSSYALRSDGTVWAWGGNAEDQLGSTSANTGTPAEVQGLPGPVKEIASGYNHVLALLEDGTVWAWGANISGQIGDGAEGASVATPVQVLTPPTGTTVTAISAGAEDSFALLSNGTFEAWGWNGHGQLGLGLDSTADKNVPTAPAAPSSVYPSGGFTAIAAGEAATYGIGANGHIYAWGFNSKGELGSSTYQWAFPYTGAAGTSTQTATEIPQEVAHLADAAWLADASTTWGQIVAAASPLVWNQSDGSTGGDPRTTTPKQFVTQPVGTLSFTHRFAVESNEIASTVTAVRITGGLDRRDFLIVGYGESELPYTITASPGGSVLSIEIRFAPIEVGEASATLEVVSSNGTLTETLEGYGTELPGNTHGASGSNGADGTNGTNGATGPQGPQGPAGPAGKNGVVTFDATASTASKASVKPGHTATLRFTLANGTSGRLPAAVLSASVPKGLHVSGGKSASIASLAAGRSRTVTLKLKVGAKAKRGLYRVKVTLKLGARRLKRTAVIRVL